MPRPALPPGDVKVPLNVRVKASALQRLDACAASVGLDRSEAVKSALSDWVLATEAMVARRDRPARPHPKR